MRQFVFIVVSFQNYPDTEQTKHQNTPAKCFPINVHAVDLEVIWPQR